MQNARSFAPILLSLLLLMLLGGCYTQLATRPVLSDVPPEAIDSAALAGRDTVIVKDHKVCYEEYNLLGYPEVRCYDTYYPYGWHRYYNQPWWQRPYSSWYRDCDCNCNNYYDYYYPRTRLCRDYCDGYCDGRWTGGSGGSGGAIGGSSGTGAPRSVAPPRGSRSSRHTPVIAPSSDSQSGSMKKESSSSTTNQSEAKETVSDSKSQTQSDSANTQSNDEEKQVKPQPRRHRPGRGR